MPPITDIEVISDQDIDITLLLPFSTIDLGDFVSVFELAKSKYGDPSNYADFHGQLLGFKLRLILLKKNDVLSKGNWITSTILKEQRKTAGKKKFASLEIYLNLPHDLILEVCVISLCSIT
jgi:hypothetical protein